jgi:hypothetical protein
MIEDTQRLKNTKAALDSTIAKFSSSEGGDVEEPAEGTSQW